jgi:hypothetical protein
MEYTKERAMEWINKNWHTPKACPICKQNNWAISESLALLSRLSPEGGVEVAGVVYPHFLLTCGTCGYTLLFNALVAGFKLSVEGQKEI